MPKTALVLGAGMVGVSVALHLQRRGVQVVLLDRNGPGEGATFGNGGLIQREAVFPTPFPRDNAVIARIARNRSIDAVYHPRALPAFAPRLLRYWWHSAPERYATAIAGHSALVRHCLDEHLALARQTPEAMALLRPIGWMRLWSDPALFEAALRQAELAAREYGVHYAALDADALAAAEPHLMVRRLGAIHWQDPLSCADPHLLTLEYVKLFEAAGGRFLHGDATTLARAGSGWRVQSAAGPLEAEAAVVALGAAALKVTEKLGYAPPLFGKRGYHMHYRLRGNAVLNRPILDTESGFLLAPMRAGVRLTTGAEFADPDAPPTPVQLERAEPVARTMLPLAERVEEQPWLGVRPCMPDMLPAIGPLPGAAGVWCAFGHGHQGLTNGPATGRLLAEMMTGEAPFVDPAPYRPDRF